MGFYKIMKQAAEIGGALEIECPDNDCRIYCNTFRMYVELKQDYTAGEDIFSETTKRAIRVEARKLGAELEKMFFNNYAIQEYRKERARERQGRMKAAV